MRRPDFLPGLSNEAYILAYRKLCTSNKALPHPKVLGKELTVVGVTLAELVRMVIYFVEPNFVMPKSGAGEALRKLNFVDKLRCKVSYPRSTSMDNCSCGGRANAGGNRSSGTWSTRKRVVGQKARGSRWSTVWCLRRTGCGFKSGSRMSHGRGSSAWCVKFSGRRSSRG